MTPLQRSIESLEGLSVGDALGQCYFSLSMEEEAISLDSKIPPPAPWLFTDDTLMSLSVVAGLVEHGKIVQSDLANDFARRYSYDRAYGPAMHRALERIRAGENWREVSYSLFEGQGSFGNGAAMRSAPIGAYFMEDFASVKREATLAAEVTHSHPEAIAGAVAVAVAAALAFRAGGSQHPPTPTEFLSEIAAMVPESEVLRRLIKAHDMERVRQISFPASILGAGQLMAAHDTVPFALWCCAQSLDNYERAIWLGIEGGVDRDTICAIIGGVVTCHVGADGIPQAWRARREPFPEWFTAAA